MKVVWVADERSALGSATVTSCVDIMKPQDPALGKVCELELRKREVNDQKRPLQWTWTTRK